MKQLVLAIAVVSLQFLHADVSVAECVVEGTIVQVAFQADQGPERHQIFLREKKRDDFHYSAETRDDELAAVAANAAANQTRVELEGDAKSCETSGTERPMGKVRSLIINP